MVGFVECNAGHDSRPSTGTPCPQVQHHVLPATLLNQHASNLAALLQFSEPRLIGPRLWATPSERSWSRSEWSELPFPGMVCSEKMRKILKYFYSLVSYFGKKLSELDGADQDWVSISSLMMEALPRFLNPWKLKLVDLHEVPPSLMFVFGSDNKSFDSYLFVFPSTKSWRFILTLIAENN